MYRCRRTGKIHVSGHGDDDGNNAFDAWSGEEMDADSANEGWYYIWVPTG